MKQTKSKLVHFDFLKVPRLGPKRGMKQPKHYKKSSFVVFLTCVLGKIGAIDEEIITEPGLSPSMLSDITAFAVLFMQRRRQFSGQLRGKMSFTLGRGRKGNQ